MNHLKRFMMMETLKAQIRDRLTPIGFVKTDNTWSRQIIQTVPGSTISINGQVMRQPDSQRNITLNIIELYEFDITDMDKGTVDDCLMLRFEILENENLAREYEINLYPTEFAQFNSIINQFFGI
jgi:hypothetical protein